MTMQIISFDPGYRNMGVIAITVQVDKYRELCTLLNSKIKLDFTTIDSSMVAKATLARLASLFDFFQITMQLKISLTEKKEKPSTYTTRKLKAYLTYITNRVKPTASDLVLCEYQMGPNDLTRGLTQQIIYHFADICQVTQLRPTLKNSISTIDRSYFLGKYRTLYSANKKQSVLAYTYITSTLDSIPPIETLEIIDTTPATPTAPTAPTALTPLTVSCVLASGKKKDDVADSCMNCIAYIKYMLCTFFNSSS